jgi:hypothetical protein
MPFSTRELANAREIVGHMLEEFGLNAYLFEVDPVDKEVRVKVECALDDEWSTVELTLEKGLVLRGMHDPDAQQSIRDQLRKALAPCRSPSG